MGDTILAKTLKDFFSGKFLFMSLAPFIAPIIILGGFFIYGSSEFFTILQTGAQSGDFSFIDEQAHPIMAYLLGFSVVHWLVMSLFVVLGTFGVVLTSLVIALLVVGLLTPVIVKVVRKRNYPQIKATQGDSLLTSLSSIAKIFMKFILLFICILPFLFLPFVNFMVFQLPFFYLFYKLMMYDLISVGISEDVLKIVEENKLYLFVVIALFFFLSLIPLFGLLLQVFFIVYLSHFILSKSEQNVNNSNLHR